MGSETSYLYDWKVWILICIIILVIVWIFKFYMFVERPVEDKDDTEVYTTETMYLSETTNTVSSIDTQSVPTTTGTVSSIDTQSVPSTTSIVPYSQTPTISSVPSYILDEDYKPKFVRENNKLSAGEKECMESAYRIFGVKFHTIRPDWLKNPLTGRNMELDIYNEQYKLAIEYNGRQHYEYTPFFHRNGIKDFEAQKARDIAKSKLCKKHGIYLITIPYTCKINDIEAMIRYKSPFAVQQRKALGV